MAAPSSLVSGAWAAATGEVEVALVALVRLDLLRARELPLRGTPSASRASMLATVIIADRPTFGARSNRPCVRRLKTCDRLQPSIADARSSVTAEVFWMTSRA